MNEFFATPCRQIGLSKMIKIHVLELEKLQKNLSTYQYPLLQPLIECVNKLEIRKKKPNHSSNNKVSQYKCTK